MAKLTRADKSACVTIRNQLDADLPVLLEHFGVQVKTGDASYNPDTGEITFKLKIKIPVGGPHAKADGFVDVYRQSWGTLVTEKFGYLGLKSGWLDKSFTAQGRTYTIVGFDHKKRAKPVRLVRDDGNVMVCAIDQVVTHMELAEKKNGG